MDSVSKVIRCTTSLASDCALTISCIVCITCTCVYLAIECVVNISLGELDDAVIVTTSRRSSLDDTVISVFAV